MMNMLAMMSAIPVSDDKMSKLIFEGNSPLTPTKLKVEIKQNIACDILLVFI